MHSARHKLRLTLKFGLAVRPHRLHRITWFTWDTSTLTKDIVGAEMDHGDAPQSTCPCKDADCMAIHSHGKFMFRFRGIHTRECGGVEDHRWLMMVQGPCHLFFLRNVQFCPTQAQRLFTS